MQIKSLREIVAQAHTHTGIALANSLKWPTALPRVHCIFCLCFYIGSIFLISTDCCVYVSLNLLVTMENYGSREFTTNLNYTRRNTSREQSTVHERAAFSESHFISISIEKRFGGIETVICAPCTPTQSLRGHFKQQRRSLFCQQHLKNYC